MIKQPNRLESFFWFIGENKVEIAGSILICCIVVALAFAFLTEPVVEHPTVLFHKDGVVVSCKQLGVDHCGMILQCGGMKVYCATNVEVMGE